jgi:hypothetical protein
METKERAISIQTLVISSLAAVAAAVVVPMIWERGTLIATAMTPVVVALVSEALRKPAEAITTVAPRVTRRSATGAAVRAPERFEPLPPEEREPVPEGREEDPLGLRAAPRPRRHWKIALATGAAAFVLAVIALTASELVFGGPATKNAGRTTFFGSGSKQEATPAPSSSATPQNEEATPEATETPTATATATPSPDATETPTPTVGAAPQTASPSPTP